MPIKEVEFIKDITNEDLFGEFLDLIAHEVVIPKGTIGEITRWGEYDVSLLIKPYAPFEKYHLWYRAEWVELKFPI